MMQRAMYKGPPNGWPRKLMHAAICAGTHSIYSHCEILIDGIGYTSSRADGGVRGKPMDLSTNHWDLFPLAGDEVKVLQWFKDHKGEPYDTMCEWKFITGRLVQTPGRWWCSQACAAACGFPLPWTFNPQQFLDYNLPQ